MAATRTYTEVELREKAARYCVGEEQCRQSVRKKLMDWGAGREVADRIVEELVEERFIDERRFAAAYCASKMRYQHWGRAKILFQLRSKGVDNETITEALSDVEQEEYEDILRRVARTKVKSLAGEADVVRNKLMAFLLSRGYEMELVRPVVEQTLKEIVEEA